jgi:hypothetical protein
MGKYFNDMFCVKFNITFLFQDLIPDLELTMTFELNFDLMWDESCFVINKNSEKWGQEIYLFYALKLKHVRLIAYKLT